MDWQESLPNLSVLIGQTMRNVYVAGDEFIFESEDGREYKLYHQPDCCEQVYLEDISGDLEDLIGSPIVMSEYVDGDIPEDFDPIYYESFTWTFYKFATNKGTVVLRWFGSSSGYYSESVTFMRTK